MLRSLLGKQDQVVIEDKDPFWSTLMPSAIYVVSVVFVLTCVTMCAQKPEPKKTWHQRYIDDHCARCPLEGYECCITIPEQ